MLAYDEYEEARWVADNIDNLVNEKGLAYSDIAILYRTNAQSRVFEDEFRRRGIPYIIVGSLSFYQRAEVKDVLAYLRLLLNSKDNLAFKRAISVPRRGVGKITLNKLEEKAYEESCSLYEASVNFQHKGIQSFCRLIEDFKGNITNHTVYEVIVDVIEKSGYRKMLEDSKEVLAEDRLMNIDELISSAYEFVKRHPDTPTLDSYLSEISLLTSIDLWDTASERVSLITVHSAKGLEFPAVFVCGLEQSLFPLAKAMGDTELLEEERRLFYVSITRCKKFLFLSSAKYRNRWGNEFRSQPSVFLEEIPTELLVREGNNAQGNDIQENDIVGLMLNAIVWHPHFGRGKIIKLRGSGKNAIVTILFERYGIKKIALAYTELEIIGY